ncbi:glycosyltransferase family 2 protein [Novosphingobium huizhouense]|uniref:glycosyltransferase family 2 protein n=1 Tax=Novosphingobium huizhouense TaxID=2866625 RepID=UPI001CD89560|nr:glycosyltransferase [Novosphingobium huizhouense]
MSYAVLELDLADLPDRLDVDPRHDGAAILLRVAGRIAGQAILGLPLGDADAPLRDVLLAHADCTAWESWLAWRLGVPDDSPPRGAPVTGTIAICTRDRPDDLATCLEGLMQMAGEAPILVIDNAPRTDESRAVVARHPAVRYVVEPRPGLDNARNRAFAETSTDVVAFIDDDARPDRHWFAQLLAGFADSTVLAVTGLTLASELETEAQIAFQRIGGLSRGFRRREFDAGSCDPFFAWEAGVGANMAVRRSALDLVGPFDPALDAGSASLAGGDFDLFRRIIGHGYRIVYDPQALNWHRHRRTLDELAHQVFSYEAGAFAIVTKTLLKERNPSAATFAARWLRHHFAARLRERRAPALPEREVDYTRLQGRGAASGPGRYLRALRQVRHG